MHALIFFLLAGFAHAELSVHPSGQSFVLSGPCAEVSRATDSLAQWTEKLGETPGGVPKSAPSAKSGKCSVPIQTLVPKFVRENLGSTKWAGPNCWNTALLVSRIIPSRRFTAGEEMSFWMNSPLCRKREPNEALAPGDIGAVRSGSGNDLKEQHGFVYLSPDLIFEKEGPSAQETYRLISPKEAFRQFKSDGSVPYRIDYYQCQSFTEYLREGHGLSEGTRAALVATDKLECQISSLLSEVSPLSRQSLSSIRSGVEVLLESVRQQIAAQSGNGLAPPTQDTLVLTSLLERLGSLQTQLLLHSRR